MSVPSVIFFSKAVNDVLPSATLNLEHPISKGYYCVIHNGKDIDEETIGKIKKRMREIIDADLPFHFENDSHDRCRSLVP